MHYKEICTFVKYKLKTIIQDGARQNYAKLIYCFEIYKAFHIHYGM